MYGQVRTPFQLDAVRGNLHDHDVTAADAEACLVLEEGKILARKYRLVKPAGFGGMAQLWVAKNESTAAEVCVKVLVPDAADEESVTRFRREAYAAARLSHRAIVRVFDLMELGPDGQVSKAGKPHALAIVMELLTGETLSDLLMKKGKLSLDEALDVIIPVAGALAHAHRAGVVHRDVKPDNVFLAKDPDGIVIPKVLDFGVSKIASSDTPGLTAAGVMLGTPSYMSPEQAKGAPSVDARSDVFSAGILFYMMLTGANPFEAESFHAVIEAIIEREPPRIAELPDAIWQVLAKALAKDPAQRWSDGTELQIALRKASGRRSTSEAAIPVARVSSDSEISLPPVGSQSVAPEEPDDDAVTLAGIPASRTRAVRVVAGVVGVAVAILVAALVRGQLASPAADAPKTATASAAPAPAPSPSPPPPVATTAAPIAAPPASSAIAITSAIASATASASATPAKRDPAPKKEPKKDKPTPGEIARDPGF